MSFPLFRVSSLSALTGFACSVVMTLSLQGTAQTPLPDAGPQPRIVATIDDSDVVTLTGNTHPLARAEYDQGAVDPRTRIERIMLLLRPSATQQQRLDQLTVAPRLNKLELGETNLAPEQYAANFGISEPDLVRITQWLRGHGFQVEPWPAGHRLIIFSGTAGQIAETFHTAIHHYSVQGQRHVANSEDPQIPRALAEVVAGVVSLHDFRRASQAHLVHQLEHVPIDRESAAALGNQLPQNSEGALHYLFPADFATIYDLNPLYAAGQAGKGIGIAIVGRSNIQQSDISSFRSYAGLPAKATTVTLDGPDPGLVSGDQDEATLDVEWSGGVAPAANVTLVAANSTAASDGVDLAAQYIVNHKTALVMSTSFGSCEASMGATETAFYNSLWQQAAAEGISAFVSSGDSGASGCDSGDASTGSGAGVNGLCSSPYSTCVGGTEFNDSKSSSTYWSAGNGAGGGSALSYIPESVWNESALYGGSGLWSSGGGISEIYTQPSWQASVSGANSNGMRAVPDVALNAASHDGYLVQMGGSWYDFAGTSAASPTMAGIMALVVEHQAGAGQGNINPTLYAMLSASESPFHSTPSGNNSVPGVGGFVAGGAAYNLATGLGSVDANVLVNHWPAASKVPQPAFALQPSIPSASLTSGKSLTFTVVVSATGGFSGTVTLSAGKLPMGVSISFNPSVVEPGSTSIATLAAATSASPGSGSILLLGKSGSLQASAGLPLVVRAAPALKIGVSALSVTVVQGKSATVKAVLNTTGSFSGTVTFSVAGLPAGVTASWNPSSLTATGTQSLPAVLTLNVSALSPVGSYPIKLVVSGAGLSAQAAETIQVSAVPGLAMTLAPAAISMKGSGAGQTVVKITPLGGLSLSAGLASAQFQALSLPAGITAAFSKPALTASGSIQTVLTLTGSKTAIAGSSLFSVKAVFTDPASKAVYSTSTQAALTLTK